VNDMTSHSNNLSRRAMLQGLACGAAAATFAPRIAFADVDTDSRFVLVILRGALDGLAAVPAYGDGHYSSLRGELAISSPGSTEGALKLDGTFALNPGLQNLYARYQAGELLVVHAVASPYRERSHFDGQDLLENGTTKPKAVQNGWLNRVLPALPSVRTRSSEKVALALAQNVPLVLQGDSRVGSWAPSKMSEADSDTLARIADLYANEPYFSSRLQAALETDAVAASGMQGEGGRDPSGALAALTSAAGRMLSASDGPRIAVMDATGWDTHANQGGDKGQLMTRLRALDRSLDELRVTMGDAWKKTAVMVVTEFGRTVAVNGTRGTDHGTGTSALLVGGAVNGGRVHADWPGLSRGNLYEGRDLKPTTDLRSVFKGVLREHLGAQDAELETHVFPDSRAAKPIEGLVRV
jgi:uncharacterized protein (DUF1501 family)